MDNFHETVESDELYWFIERKTLTATRENLYIMTTVSREPRQIVGFDVAFDKSPERIQKMADNAHDAYRYCSYGYLGYNNVVYPGNIRDKSVTPIQL